MSSPAGELGGESMFGSRGRLPFLRTSQSTSPNDSRAFRFIAPCLPQLYSKNLGRRFMCAPACASMTFRSHTFPVAATSTGDLRFAILRVHTTSYSPHYAQEAIQ
jgi:hypothetical protein